MLDHVWVWSFPMANKTWYCFQSKTFLPDKPIQWYFQWITRWIDLLQSHQTKHWDVLVHQLFDYSSWRPKTNKQNKQNKFLGGQNGCTVAVALQLWQNSTSSMTLLWIMVTSHCRPYYTVVSCICAQVWLSWITMSIGRLLSTWV